jgi:hypothetical protein
VIEQHAVAGIHAIGFTVVDRDPVGIELGHGVRRTRIERRRLALRDFLDQAIEFGRRGLVEAGLLFQTEEADRLKQAKRSDGVDIGGVFGSLEAHGNVALRAQIVDFVRLDFLNDARQVRSIRQVAIVQLEIGRRRVRILVDMIDALRIEQRGTALDTMHFIALFEQKFCKIRTVLARHARDKGNLLTAQRPFPSIEDSQSTDNESLPGKNPSDPSRHQLLCLSFIQTICHQQGTRQCLYAACAQLLLF